MEKETVTKAIGDAQGALFSIHGLAQLLEKASGGFEDVNKSEISNPLVTFAQTIQDYAATALDALDGLEDIDGATDHRANAPVIGI